MFEDVAGDRPGIRATIAAMLRRRGIDGVEKRYHRRRTEPLLVSLPLLPLCRPVGGLGFSSLLEPPSLQSDGHLGGQDMAPQLLGALSGDSVTEMSGGSSVALDKESLVGQPGPVVLIQA